MTLAYQATDGGYYVVTFQVICHFRRNRDFYFVCTDFCYNFSALICRYSSVFIRRIIHNKLDACPFKYTAFVVIGEVGMS